MPPRRIHQTSHDDGLNAWSTTRAAPAPALAGLITGYADYSERTAGFTTRRELPHPGGVLIFNLGAPIRITGGDGAVLHLQSGEAFIAGPHLRPALSHSGGSQAGIQVFLPLTTLHRLLRTPMHQLADQAAPLDAFIGSPARALGERLLNAPTATSRMDCLDLALTQLLEAAPDISPQTLHAVELLQNCPGREITTIARHIGWSRKHLASRLHEAVGIGPRSFQRLHRFQSLLALLEQPGAAPDWAGLAQQAGYYDQSHMIREFRGFSGITPATYHARLLPGGGGLPEDEGERSAAKSA